VSDFLPVYLLLQRNCPASLPSLSSQGVATCYNCLVP
jgi:hypothetical protein